MSNATEQLLLKAGKIVHGGTNYVVIILASLCLHFILDFEARVKATEKQSNENSAAISVIKEDIVNLAVRFNEHRDEDRDNFNHTKRIPQ